MDPTLDYLATPMCIITSAYRLASINQLDKLLNLSWLTPPPQPFLSFVTGSDDQPHLSDRSSVE